MSHLLFLLGLLAFALGGCLMGGGSDTETAEPLAGVLVDSEGMPVAGARVRLVPVGYDPTRPDTGALRGAVTDAVGRFAFPAADTGRYNLVADKDGQAAFVPNLAPDSLPGTVALARARTLFITLHGDTYQTADSGRAYFPGTDILIRCEGRTATRADAIPMNLERLVLESRAGWRHDYRLDVPGDTVTILADRNRVLATPR